MQRQTFTLKNIILIFILISLGSVGFILRINVFYGASLSLGLIFFLLLTPLLGKVRTFLIAESILIIVGLITDTYEIMFLHGFELAFILYMPRRFPSKKDFLVWDLIYWLVTIPIIHLYLYSNNIHQHIVNAEILYLMLLINGLMNTATADIVLKIPFTSRHFNIDEKSQPDFHLIDLVFSLIIIGMALTTLNYTLFAARRFANSVTDTAYQDMSGYINTIEVTLDQIPDLYQHYIHVDNSIGVDYLFGTVDALTIPGSSIHISLDDQSFHPSMPFKEPYTLRFIQEGFYQIIPQTKITIFKTYFHEAGSFFLYTKRTTLGQVAIFTPIRYFRSTAYDLYFKQLPILLVSSIFTGLLIKIFLGYTFNNYADLIAITDKLPEKIQEGDPIPWPEFHIYELRLLVNHFRDMSHHLTELFQEAEASNEELETQALQLIASEQQLRNIALTDALTGLPNRHHFQDYLDQMLVNAPEITLALVFIDLDRFKHVNDTYGHDIGDLLLKEISKRLTHTFDLAFSEDHMVARLGGDEFVLILHYDTFESLHTRLETIVEGLNHPMNLGSHTIYSVASFGVALYPKDGQNKDDLMKKADATMYHSKNNGGNQITYYDPWVHVDYEKDLSLEYELHEAIAQEEFIIHYQPIVTYKDKHIVYLEGLIRWMHPKRGLLNSSEFIDIANGMGVMNLLETYVFDKLCRAHDQFTTNPLDHYPVFINLSGHQLDQHTLIDDLKKFRARYPNKPSCLALDISADSLYRNTQARLKILTELKSMNILLCYDGYSAKDSSMEYLRKELFDYVKVDLKAYNHLEISHQTMAILKSLKSYCDHMNMEIIYKGVETKSLYDQLAPLDPSYVQGFYLARPMNESHLIDLVTRLKEVPLDEM